MIVDLNCGVGRWPFREYGARTVDALEAIMAIEQIDTAYPSSIDAVFAADPDAANRDLIAACSGRTNIHPIPVINPRLRQWKRALEEYRSTAPIAAIKIHPNYHGWSLDDPEDPRKAGPGLPGFADDLSAHLIKLGLPVLIPVRLIDDRFHPYAMKVPPVPVGQVRGLARRFPELRIVCLNPYLNDVRMLRDEANVFVDLASVEYFRTLDTLIAAFAPERIVFGTNTPFYVARAGIMKLAWAEADKATIMRIAGGNAMELLA